MKVDETVRVVWSPRVGEAAAAKMVQAQRARLVQLCSCAVLFVCSMIPLMSQKSTWVTLPVAFRACFAIFALLVIFFGMFRQGQRRSRYVREAAVCALNHLRATTYPKLTRLPYVTMRSPQAFDKYIGSTPSSLMS
jgi:hypothetical protein